MCSKCCDWEGCHALASELSFGLLGRTAAAAAKIPSLVDLATPEALTGLSGFVHKAALLSFVLAMAPASSHSGLATLKANPVCDALRINGRSTGLRGLL